MSIKNEASEFASFLENWMIDLPVLGLTKGITQPKKTAIVSVDIINGFCYTGPLSSPRIAGIVDPICSLFTRAWDLGVRHFLLTQDLHDDGALEFAQFPVHCKRGTTECETVDEFKALPFSANFIIFPKNSTHSGLNTGLQSWIDAHSEVDTYIVVGDCTDLCTYQLAMHLRLDAYARQLQRRVLLPENCVQTYDTPVPFAIQNGLMPHPGDFLHAQFLYHMAMNGIEVVKKLE